jgi:hypothetical protein
MHDNKFPTAIANFEKFEYVTEFDGVKFFWKRKF